jgi:zinc transport system permease protein
MTLLGLDFMRHALAAAGVVGLVAPAIGVFIVQRRLALLGDGIGHVALAGVAAGLVTGTSPVVTAMAAAAAGAVVIELIRERAKAAGDVALALLFYGGIAAGVFLAGFSAGSGGSLFAYLFGSVLTVSRSDLVTIGALSLAVLVLLGVLGKQLFAIAYDEEVAKAAGIRVRALNLALAMTAAVTVVVGMRVVGLLLVAALMVIPVATAQAFATSFRSTVWGSVAFGVLASVGGVVVAFYLDAFPGATIVLTALGLFVLTTAAVRSRPARARS